MLDIIITGYDFWNKYTLPAIKSFRAHCAGDEYHIWVVDQAGKYPLFGGPEVTTLRLDTVARPAAINYALSYCKGEWIMICDNDVLCKAPLWPEIKNLEDGIYGYAVMAKDYFEKARVNWIDGWCFTFSRKVFETVGYVDYGFYPSGFWDADYCFSANKAGFPVKSKHFPIKHFQARTKYSIHTKRAWTAYRMLNMDYLARKWNLKIKENE